ncbi:hypothetical protein [Gilvibacter sp.]|uniref:hypothetical protein n=1 Tax=Gilvibacter sp. TaxID=2729997 RepID=UPI003F4A23F4
MIIPNFSLALPTWGWVLVLFVVVFVSFLALNALLFNTKQIVLRSIKKMSAIPLYSAKNGTYVRVHGNAQLGESQLRSPLTDLPCAAYKVKVFVRKNDGESLIFQDLKIVPFSISDGSDIAKIVSTHPQLCRFHLRTHLHMDSKGLKVDREKYNAFLKQAKISEADGLLKIRRTLYFEESILLPGDKVAIAGVANWSNDNSQRTLELTASVKKKLLVTNDPEAFPKNSSN